MARIMGIDFGLKRIGIAVTDPFKMVCTPLQTCKRSDVKDFLKNYINSEEVEIIVVGVPLNLNGTDTDATPHVRRFMKELEELFPNIPIESVDERYTSKSAKVVLLNSGAKKSKRRDKSLIDKISASIILEQYMKLSKIWD